MTNIPPWDLPDDALWKWTQKDTDAKRLGLRLEREMKMRLCNRCGGDSFEPSTMHDVIGGDGRRWRLCAECFKSFSVASSSDSETTS